MTGRPEWDGKLFVTPSGRRWEANVGGRIFGGKAVLTPLGSDTYGFGGVKRRVVDPERLDGTDKTWRPIDA